MFIGCIYGWYAAFSCTKECQVIYLRFVICIYYGIIKISKNYKIYHMEKEEII